VTQTPTQRTVSTRTWWVLGTLGVLVMSAIAVWFGLAASVGKVHWTNTGHSITSDTEARVMFQLVRDPAREVTCRLQALDERRGTVGTVDVAVPPTEASPSSHTEPVRTVTRALTAYVERCWYTDEDGG
jgi:hypothetical protein